MNHFQFPVRFGTIFMIWNSEGLLNRIEWSENRLAIAQRVQLPTGIAKLADQLRAYFYEGQPIETIPWSQVDQSGWTDFQKEVYLTISRIPHGETRTYGWVAARLGRTSASRAVGQALRKNPIPILIPCHRITTASCKQGMSGMGGFMGVVDPSLPQVKLKYHLIRMEEEYRSPLFSFLTGGPAWMDCNLGLSS